MITVHVPYGRGEAFVAAARPLYALDLFEESLALARHIGNRRYEGENLQMIGWLGMGLAGTADYPLAQKALSALRAKLPLAQDVSVIVSNSV